MKKIRQLVDESLKTGWRMTKKMSSAGLFTDATYDDRIVYTREELHKLVKEGFVMETNMGKVALNILLGV